MTEETMVENLNGGNYNEMDYHPQRHRVCLVRICLFFDIQINERIADQCCVSHIIVND